MGTVEALGEQVEARPSRPARRLRADAASTRSAYWSTGQFVFPCRLASVPIGALSAPWAASPPAPAVRVARRGGRRQWWWAGLVGRARRPAGSRTAAGARAIGVDVMGDHVEQALDLGAGAGSDPRFGRRRSRRDGVPGRNAADAGGGALSDGRTAPARARRADRPDRPSLPPSYGVRLRYRERLFIRKGAGAFSVRSYGPGALITRMTRKVTTTRDRVRSLD